MHLGVLSGSFGVVGFIHLRPGCRRVHSGSLGSFGCAPVVVCFIRGREVHSGAPGCRRVHFVSLGSFWCALGVVRFISGRSVHFGAFWGSLGSLGVVVGVIAFIPVHPSGRWVHSRR